MARVTVEDCLNTIDNRFELVLVAAKRAHQLNSGGYKTQLDSNKDKPTVLALREIEAGIIDSSILSDEYKLQNDVINHEDSIKSQDKIQEIKEELSETFIDNNVDDISIKE